MTTKPFKVIIDEDHEEETAKAQVKPHILEPDPELDTVLHVSEKKVPKHRNHSGIQSGIKLLSSLSGILLSFLLFVFIYIFAHTIDSISHIFISASLADYFYLFGLLLLFSALSMNIISNFKQLRQLKDASQLKEQFTIQKENPTNEIITLSNEILFNISHNRNAELQSNFDEIKLNINNTQDYHDIYNLLDNELLSPLDKKAKALIQTASLQAAFSTAISPVPIIDMFIIIWRSLKLAKDISQLYGYKPGGLTNIILLKHGLINVVFAGVSELSIELTNEITSASVMHKVSHAAGQGVINGILLARLGHGILEACRPIKLSEKRDNITKSIVDSIINSFKTREKVKN